MLTIGVPARRRASWRNRRTEYEIPNARRYAKVARHWVVMVTKMAEPMVAQPGFLGKLPAVHGIVNQQIQNVPHDYTACRSAGDLDIPKPRDKKKEEGKAGDAYPDRRSDEVTWMGVVHQMKFLQAGTLW